MKIPSKTLSALSLALYLGGSISACSHTKKIEEKHPKESHNSIEKDNPRIDRCEVCGKG